MAALGCRDPVDRVSCGTCLARRVMIGTLPDRVSGAEQKFWSVKKPNFSRLSTGIERILPNMGGAESAERRICGAVEGLALSSGGGGRCSIAGRFHRQLDQDPVKSAVGRTVFS